MFVSDTSDSALFLIVLQFVWHIHFAKSVLNLPLAHTPPPALDLWDIL